MAANPSNTKKKIGKSGLTPEETELQISRGLIYKQLVEEATFDFAQETQKPAILLSGGADSTVTYFAARKAGLKPIAITFHVPDTPISRDANSAKYIAEKEGLDFYMTELPDDPDYVARRIHELFDHFHDVYDSRADFEVLFLLDQMFSEARRQGCDSVYTGIGDCEVHLTGRKNEIRGRNGLFTVSETNGQRTFPLNNGQFLGVVKLGAQIHELSVCSPIHAAVMQQPYFNVPWHVMNVPVNKHISLYPWREDFERLNFRANVQAMQTGDAGTREYFDRMMSESEYAKNVAQKSVTTAIVYYNALQRRREEEHKSTRSEYERERNFTTDLWNSFRRGVNGEEQNPKWEAGWYQVDKDGMTTTLPYGYEDPDAPKSDDSDDIFGSLVEADDSENEEWFPGEDGKPDRRMDCLGQPFWKGPDVAMTNCERAQMGLCGKPHPEVPHRLEKCEVWDIWMDGAIDECMIELSEIMEELPGNGVYAKWGERARESSKKIAEGSLYRII